MAELTRHVGKLNNTGQKCVIVYRQLPGEDDSAVIVQSDQLPDMYHDNLMRVLREPQTQQAVELSEILTRRQFANGENMLNALHNGSFLRKTDVDNITLYPYPNQPVELRLVNEQLGNIAGTMASAPADAVDADAATKAALAILEGTDPNAIPVTTPIPVVDANDSIVIDTSPDPINVPDGSTDSPAIAANLLAKADKLEQEMERLREAAYSLDPETRPTKGRPKLTAEERARKREEQNEKRRKKYKSNKKDK